MRRRLYALALCLLPISACSLPYYEPGQGQGRYGPMPGDAADYLEAPVRARLYEDDYGLRVQLNQPAYIAVFEIAPGLGASLVYPEFQSERSYLSSGTSRVWLNRRTRGSMYYGYDVGDYATRQPRHFLLIASRRPLYLSQIQDNPGYLRRQLGYTAFTSMNARNTMNQIADMVLPNVADDEWDSDVVTVWPERYTRLAGYTDDEYIRVRCPDGTLVTTYYSWLPYACNGYGEGGRGYRRRGQGNYDPPPPPPHDSTGTGRDSLRVPGRHRPEPRDSAVGTAPRVPGRIAADPTVGDDPRDAPEGRHVRPGTAEPADEPEFRPRQEPRLEPRHAIDRPADGGQGEESGRTRPRAADPSVGPPAEEPARGAPRQVEPRRQDPPADHPYEAPRREEPRYEQPRREEPRPEPVREQPRPEPVREQPRPEPPPRQEPAREAPRPEPAHEAPRAEPPPSRPSAEPAPPPA
jgi:hypothetical protein